MCVVAKRTWSPVGTWGLFKILWIDLQIIEHLEGPERRYK